MAFTIMASNIERVFICTLYQLKRHSFYIIQLTIIQLTTNFQYFLILIGMRKYIVPYLHFLNWLITFASKY